MWHSVVLYSHQTWIVTLCSHYCFHNNWLDVNTESFCLLILVIFVYFICQKINVHITSILLHQHDSPYTLCAPICASRKFYLEAPSIWILKEHQLKSKLNCKVYVRLISPPVLKIHQSGNPIHIPQMDPCQKEERLCTVSAYVYDCIVLYLLVTTCPSVPCLRNFKQFYWCYLMTTFYWLCICQQIMMLF